MWQDIDNFLEQGQSLHTEIFPNLKSISELFKMGMKSLDSFILASRDNWIACNQTLGGLRLYRDSRVSQAQSRNNAYEILLQYDWLLFFHQHNRLAETHSYLKLSYQITDRLLAAGNNVINWRRPDLVKWWLLSEVVNNLQSLIVYTSCILDLSLVWSRLSTVPAKVSKTE